MTILHLNFQLLFCFIARDSLFSCFHFTNCKIIKMYIIYGRIYFIVQKVRKNYQKCENIFLYFLSLSNKVIYFIKAQITQLFHSPASINNGYHSPLKKIKEPS